MKKVLLCLVLAVVFCFSQSKIIKDMAGNDIKIPVKVEKIAALWHANNQILFALGGYDKVVATTDSISKNKWFNHVFKPLKSIPVLLNNNDINLEELLKVNPDIVIVSNTSMLQTLQKQGFAAIKASFTNYDEMVKSINLTASIIGEDAKIKADELISYLQRNIKIAQEKTANLNPSNRLKVLHIADKSDLLKVDGKKSIIDEWISVAGGVNAVDDKEGTLFVITAEQVAITDPDVIIIGGTNGDEAVDKIYKSPIFAGTKAVKNRRVFSNPRGVFNWDRYGAESALQILWAAKTLHPELFKEIDLSKESKWFYKNFMNYELSDDEFSYILKGLSPQGK